jgi:type I restriction enzyme, S subunit
MSLLDATLTSDRRWSRLGDHYEVTRKPRGLQMPPVVPFSPMEMLPQGGSYGLGFELRPTDTLTSGTYYERGDVLVAKITPSFENGKRALATNVPHPFGFATTEVIPLRPTSGRDPRFLFFYLLHPDICASVAERMEGATGRQRVPERILLDLPFPELRDQATEKTIADTLQLCQSAIVAEQSALNHSRRVKAASLRYLFTRGLRGEPQKDSPIGRVPASWPIADLGSLCTSLSGGTPPKSDRKYWVGEVPWVSGKDLKRNRLSDTVDHISMRAAEEYSKIAPEHSVLVLIRGMGLAKGFALALIERPMAFNQDLKALVPGDKLSGSYLMHALTEAGPRMLANITTAAHGTKRLSQSDVLGFPVPVPPLVEQQEIATILDVLDAKIDIHVAKSKKLDALFHALLHKLVIGGIQVSDLNLSALTTQSEESLA